MSNPVPQPSKIFISYSHDSPAHKNRVLRLSNRLREGGLRVNLDQFETSPPEGWPRWAAREVDEADFVITVCTEIYGRHFQGKGMNGEGRGVNWEGAHISQILYDQNLHNTKFVPVVFSESDLIHIPACLRQATFYDLSTEEGYVALYRRVTHQPAITKAPLGIIKNLNEGELNQQAPTAKDSASESEQILNQGSPPNMTVTGEVKRRTKSRISILFVSALGLLALIAFLIFSRVLIPRRPDPKPIIELTPNRVLANESAVMKIALDPSGDLAASADAEGSVMIWNGLNGAVIRVLQSDPGAARQLQQKRRPATCVALSSDSQLVASGDNWGRISLWRVNDGQLLWSRKYSRSVFQIYFTADLQRVLSASMEDDDTKVLQFTKIESGDPLPQQLTLNPDEFLITISANLQTAAVYSKATRKVQLRSLNDGTVLVEFGELTFFPSGGAISIDGRLLVLGSKDGPLYLYECKTGKLLRDLRDQNSEVSVVAFHPNGQIVATGFAKSYRRKLGMKG